MRIIPFRSYSFHIHFNAILWIRQIAYSFWVYMIISDIDDTSVWHRRYCKQRYIRVWYRITAYFLLPDTRWVGTPLWQLAPRYDSWHPVMTVDTHMSWHSVWALTDDTIYRYGLGTCDSYVSVLSQPYTLIIIYVIYNIYQVTWGHEPT